MLEDLPTMNSELIALLKPHSLVVCKCFIDFYDTFLVFFFLQIQFRFSFISSRFFFFISDALDNWIVLLCLIRLLNFTRFGVESRDIYESASSITHWALYWDIQKPIAKAPNEMTSFFSAPHTLLLFNFLAHKSIRQINKSESILHNLTQFLNF